MSPLITVWRIPLLTSDAVLSKLQALLSDEEKDKAARFKSDIHRRRYIVSHGAMRSILSGETECAPDKLRFVQSASGKPALDDPFAHVQFNLSHSADMALLAVCPHGAVGVDIEEQGPLADLAGMVTQVCSASEARLVMSSTDAEQVFYRCWVGKEAILKCLGWGLNTSMKEVDVLDARGNLTRLPTLPSTWPDTGAVNLQLLDILLPRFIGAVAVQQSRQNDRTDFKVHIQEWPPGGHG